MVKTYFVVGLLLKGEIMQISAITGYAMNSSQADYQCKMKSPSFSAKVLIPHGSCESQDSLLERMWAHIKRRGSEKNH